MNAAAHRPGSIFTSLAALLPAVIIACAPALQAQPVLTFKRLVNNWPTIELYFTVACDGQPAWHTDKRYFTVVENGVMIRDFELWCPDETLDCANSVAMVFDASASMSGAGNTGAKAAGNALVDEMWPADEAAIIWFNSSVTVRQGITTSQDQLRAAINALPASGGTAVWDGAYAGVLEIINNSVNMCQAVIVLVDGQDNSSSRQPADVIALANQHRVRVYTIGLGGPINSAQLQSIANLTGGRYYETPTASPLVAFYQEIFRTIRSGHNECMISYTGAREDGSLRTVELSLSNYCNGADTATRSYRAPLTGIADPVARPAALEVYPDPCPGTLTLRIPTQAGEAIRVTVSDMLGRVLLARGEAALSELHTCAVPLAGAPPGSYVVAVESGGHRWMRTVRRY
jgi:Mg-chelatase subunit ChlD